jgi:hypothetical protein
MASPSTNPSFLFLFRGGNFASQSAEQKQQHMQKWVSWMKTLSDAGQFKGGEPLEGTGRQVRGKKKVVIDGPYTESKDLVGGYLLVSAPSLEAATELALGCPILETDGQVEVRPIAQMGM